MHAMRIIALLAIVSTAAAGQGPPKMAPPTRNLGPVAGSLDSLFTTVSIVRTLSTGQLLVLDVRGQQVAFVEPDLKKWKIVADTTLRTGRAFAQPGGLIPYTGDTTYLVDPRGLSLVSIDPQGKIGRVVAMPRPNEASLLTGGFAGFPGFDQVGRIVYRGLPSVQPPPMTVGRDGFVEVPSLPESYPLIRVDMTSRRVDTATFVKVAANKFAFYRSPSGMASVLGTTNPLPAADDWAVLPNGTIAVVRVTDYHVDFVTVDGKITIGPKIPFDWERFDDAKKVAFIDSTKSALQLLNPTREYRVADAKERAPAEMYGLNPDGTRIVRTEGSYARGSAAGTERSTTAAIPERPVLPTVLIAPEHLPDFAPPFAPGSTRVDFDGRLWIRTSATIGGSPLYHVVDATGTLVDRVLIPAGRVIAGFGPRGVVYMGMRDGAWTRLERATLAPKK